jgi:hypothetical protein
MGKWIVCSLLATLLVLAAFAQKSGSTPVGTNLVPATTSYSPGVLSGGDDRNVLEDSSRGKLVPHFALRRKSNF